MKFFLPLIIWVLILAADGRISAEQAAGLLVVLAVLVAVSTRLATVVSVFLILVEVSGFLKRYSADDLRAQAGLLSSLAELALLLTGIWLMVHGVVLACRPSRASDSGRRRNT